MNSGQTDTKAALDAFVGKINDAVAYGQAIQPAFDTHNAPELKADVQAAVAALQAVLPKLLTDSSLVEEISDIT